MCCLTLWFLKLGYKEKRVLQFLTKCIYILCITDLMFVFLLYSKIMGTESLMELFADIATNDLCTFLKPELEEIFGYEYDEEEDSQKVKSLLEFGID